MRELRLLGPSDAPALIAFLEQRVDTSLILLSNTELAGLEDHGKPLQGTYVASFANGEITAVAAHCWNGIVVVQGDVGLEDAVKDAVSRSGRRLHGLIGPLDLVQRARGALGAESRRTAKDDPEILYALDLEELRVPELLATPGVTCTRPDADESADLLVEWRIEFAVEALGEERSPALREKSKALLSRLGRTGWILRHDGNPVSYSTFSASTHGVVQVGGVFTPPHLRNRGYGRAVVAGCLLDVRNEGQKRSVLFTPQKNIAAQRAYASLGYRPIGEFGLVLFTEE
jgi:RimJ/RimL family protein N-acetyltransferase